MNKTLLAVVALIALCGAVLADNWAVLVAGSNYYYNYRHQADVCHAFQMLRKNGIPESNIIVFMYDDIANNAQNPKKGTIINYPGGKDVYQGVPKDYTGKDVTPENFLKVLRGEKTGVGSGKTLQTGPNDNVFVFFSDHGATGLVAFPNEMLYAKDLINTLKNMHDNKKYNKLVFYLEACESGSMFNNLLPTSWNIYATTASNPFESSYACYYDNTVNAYTADCYSYLFMNDTENNSIRTETLQIQYGNVKKLTTMSHVCQYGDVSIAKEVVGNYLGKVSNRPSAIEIFNQMRAQNQRAAPKMSESDMMDSRKIKEEWLKRMILSTNDAVAKSSFETELKEHIAQQERSDIIFGAFVHSMKIKSIVPASNDADHCYSQLAVDVDCVKDANEAFQAACGKYNETNFKYAKVVSDACSMGYSAQEIGNKFSQICAHIRA